MACTPVNKPTKTGLVGQPSESAAQRRRAYSVQRTGDQLVDRNLDLIQQALREENGGLVAIENVMPALLEAAGIVGTGGGVDDSTGLGTTPITDLSEGTIRFVGTFRSFFRLDKTNSDGWTADGVSYISALGGIGMWIRLPIADPYWVTQTTWYWDPVSGDDENSGASGAPIQTHEEFYRRTNGGRFASNVVINILSNIPNQVFRVGYIAPFATYQAVLQEAGSGSITALATYDAATNQTWELTDSALGTSWTSSAFVDKLLVARNGGGAVVGTAWVDKDLGAKTARMAGATITEPLLVAGATAAVTSSTTGAFSVGNTYKIYDFLTCAISQAIMNVRESIVIYGLRYTGSTVVASQPVLGQGFMSLCKFSSTVSLVGRVGSFQCLFTAACTITQNFAFHTFNSHKGLCQIQYSPDFTLNATTWFSNGGALRVTHGSRSTGTGPLPDIAIFDATATSLTVDHQSFLQAGRIWGNTNANPGFMVVVGFGSWIYVSVVPNLATAGTHLSLLGTVYSWTDVDPLGVVDSRNMGMIVGSS